MKSAELVQSPELLAEFHQDLLYATTYNIPGDSVVFCSFHGVMIFYQFLLKFQIALVYFLLLASQGVLGVLIEMWCREFSA